MKNEEKCIICEKIANAKNSHIVPMNLIKECIGERHNEISYNLNISQNAVDREIYIGDAIKHKEEELNDKKLKLVDFNPYTLDNILCITCEKKLGEKEGKVYSEIICKIRDEKHKNNFKHMNYSKFDALISVLKKITKNDLDIYFYSIILRFYKQMNINKLETNIKEETILSIKNYLNSNLYQPSNNSEDLKCGLIVYVTNNPKKFPTIMETNLFNKLIIPCCHFFIVLEENKTETPFGNCINLVSDPEFKFLKNSIELDEAFSII